MQPPLLLVPVRPSYLFLPLLFLTTLFLASSNIGNGLLSEATLVALHTVAAAPTALASNEALVAHVRDLETELHNCDFRLQFLYNQRLSALQLIDAARRQIAEANRTEG